MANFFLDNKDLQFHMNHPLMKKIVELKEKEYADKDAYDYAPVDFEDAQDSYRRVMEIVGEVCGDVIAPNAEGVDHDGPKVVNDHVEYAPGTARNIEALRQAGLFGLTLPRKYEGLNFPLVYFVMANEMVARADAGFENIWGLQDCAETLNEFASEELKAKYLPRVSRGETCAMDLTEPDAGSDLQAVMLKAHWDEAKGTWLLNGVKRFITISRWCWPAPRKARPTPGGCRCSCTTAVTWRSRCAASRTSSASRGRLLASSCSRTRRPSWSATARWGSLST